MATVQVPRRLWGKTGLSIPVIPFGTQGFGNHFGDVHDDSAIALVHHAIELGVNHFDCARCYGDSLRKLGLALQGVAREKVIISARLCLHRVLTPLQLEHAGTADDVIRDVEDQLKILHIDYLDALLLHDPSDMGPVLSKGGALEGALRLKDRGLVRHVGFGMRPHDFHMQALDTGAVDVMLTFSDYNLLRRSAAEPGGLLEHATKHGVGVLNGFSIMRGILTGAPVAEAAERGRWTNAEDIARATAMRQWAIDREVNLLDIALQFCLAESRIHGNPLGNQNIAELEHNVAAVSKPLPDGILKEFMGAAL